MQLASFCRAKSQLKGQVVTRFIVGLGNDSQKSSLNMNCHALIFEMHFKAILQDRIFHSFPEKKFLFQKAPCNFWKT